jgi:copper chaperone CopZ
MLTKNKLFSVYNTIIRLKLFKIVKYLPKLNKQLAIFFLGIFCMINANLPSSLSAKPLNAHLGAEENSKSYETKNPHIAPLSTAFVELKGVVCDFCVGVLKKVFTKQPEVKEYSVNLDTKVMTLVFKENAQIDDATITKLVEDAGYNVTSIKRSEGK